MIKDDELFKKLKEIALARGDGCPEEIFDGELFKKLSLPCPSCNYNGLHDTGEVCDPEDLQMSFNFLTHTFFCPECEGELSPREILEYLWKFEQECQKQSGDFIRLLGKLQNE